MSTKVKLLLYGMIIGLAGMAVMVGVIMGTGDFISREAEAVYPIDEPFETVMLDTVRAEISIAPVRGAYNVEATVKAWRSEPIDIDDIVSVQVKQGVLTIVETPLPNEFLGMFPQPYSLELTIRIPEGMDYTVRGDAP